MLRTTTAFLSGQEQRDQKQQTRNDGLVAIRHYEQKRKKEEKKESIKVCVARGQVSRARVKQAVKASVPATSAALRGRQNARRGRQKGHVGRVVLSDAERKQRAADQVAVVLQALIGSRRQLYGKLLKDASSTFRSFDRDGSGQLDYMELGEAMQRLGLGLKADQLQSLATAMDADSDGQVSLHEFVQHIEGASKRLARARRAVINVETPLEVEGSDEGEEKPAQRVAQIEIVPKIDIASLHAKERMDLMFDAVIAQDEQTVLALLRFGVSIDVPRTTRRAGVEKETPRDIAKAQGPNSRSARAIATFSAHARQRAICTSLVATQSLMSEMSTRIREENGNQLERVVQAASRPWRDHAALEQCGNDAHAAMQIGHTLGLVRALNKRARLFVEAHEYQNAILDYSMVLSLCEEEGGAAETAQQSGEQFDSWIEGDLDAMLAEVEAQEMGRNSTRKTASRMQEAWHSEREETLDTTLLRRGLVYRLAEENEHALTDLETAWARFRAKRVALGLQGVTINPTPLLDRAAQAMHVLKFKVRMKTIGSSGAKIKAVKTAQAKRAMRRMKGAKFQWAEIQKQHAKAISQRGITALWLIEWATRNEIPGFGSWIADSEKGSLVAQRLVAKGFDKNGAKRAIAMVTAGRVVGLLKNSSLEALVVKANRHNRVQVVIPGGDRKFWYAAADLQQQPLSASDIKKKFENIDEDQSGVLDRDEVARAVSALCGGVDLDDKQLNAAMEEMDGDGSGEVSLSEFTTWFMNTKNSPDSGDARFLAFTEGDRVCLKQEAVERLRAQEELPRLEHRALAWANEHQLDDDFEKPMSMPPNVAGVVDQIIAPATALDPEVQDWTPKGEEVADVGSFAKEFCRRPVLQTATHYAIYSDETPFWDLVLGLVGHQLGLEKALEVRWFTPAQLKLELIRHGKMHAANYYHLDLFFTRPSAAHSSKAQERALKTVRAVGDVVLVLDQLVPKREPPPVLKSAKLLRRLCAGLKMDKRQKNGQLPNPGLQLGLSFGALEGLSKQLWCSLADAKKRKSSLSVVYGATQPVRSGAPLVRQVGASIETVVERRLEAAARAVVQEQRRELRVRQIWKQLEGVRHDFSTPIRTAPVMSAAGSGAGSNNQVKTQELKSATALSLISGAVAERGGDARSMGVSESILRSSEFHPQLTASETSAKTTSVVSGAIGDVVAPLKITPPVVEVNGEKHEKSPQSGCDGFRGQVGTPGTSPRVDGISATATSATAAVAPTTTTFSGKKPPVTPRSSTKSSNGGASRASALEGTTVLARPGSSGRKFKVATTSSMPTSVTYKTTGSGFRGKLRTLVPCISRVLEREGEAGAVTTKILKSSISRVAERRAFHQLGPAKNRPLSAPPTNRLLLSGPVNMYTPRPPEVPCQDNLTLQEEEDYILDLRLPNTNEEVCVVGGVQAFSELCAVVEEHSALPPPRSLTNPAAQGAQAEDRDAEPTQTGNGSRHIGVILNSLLEDWQKAFTDSVAAGRSSSSAAVDAGDGTVACPAHDKVAGGVEIRRVQVALNESLSVQRPSLREWVRTRFVWSASSHR